MILLFLPVVISVAVALYIPFHVERRPRRCPITGRFQ